MNALQKSILIPTAIGTFANGVLASNIGEKTIDEFLRRQSSICQLWVVDVDSVNKDRGYNFSTVSETKNPYKRPHSRSTEVTTDLANICNFAYQGLPDKVEKSRFRLKDYFIKEMGIVNADTSVIDSLIVPTFSPDSSTIVEWSYRGNVDDYIKKCKTKGVKPVIDKSGKLLIFNEEASADRRLHSLWFPFRDIEDLYKRVSEERVKEVVVRGPLEFGLFSNYSPNKDFVLGVSSQLPLIKPVRFNFGFGFERTESLPEESSSMEFISGNRAYHTKTGNKKINLYDFVLSYPIKIYKGFELEPGLGISAVRENKSETIVDQIVSPEGYVLDQDVDNRSSDVTNGRFRGYVEGIYNLGKFGIGGNIGIRGNKLVYGAGFRFKIPRKR